MTYNKKQKILKLNESFTNINGDEIYDKNYTVGDLLRTQKGSKNIYEVNINSTEEKMDCDVGNSHTIWKKVSGKYSLAQSGLRMRQLVPAADIFFYVFLQMPILKIARLDFYHGRIPALTLY